jgi:hypothetical protein
MGNPVAASVAVAAEMVTQIGVLAEGLSADFEAHAKSRNNYAGTSPITRASGTKKTVLARHVRNRRLADATYMWAFASRGTSLGARAYDDARRAASDGHHQALRAPGNRLVGILHGCLTHHVAYDESIALGESPRERVSKCRLSLQTVGCLGRGDPAAERAQRLNVRFHTRTRRPGGSTHAHQRHAQ